MAAATNDQEGEALQEQGFIDWFPPRRRARAAAPFQEAIGPYQLERRLGRGGMAEVFTATHCGAVGFQRMVCLKRILPELASDSEFRELFVKEARLAGKLGHANIVQVFDCVEDGQSLAIVMEMVDGMDLKELILRLRRRGRALPEEVVAFVAGQLLSGLRSAHEEQVIHRDISPHNVLVSRRGEIKLADFGVAKALLLTKATRTGGLKGKLAYMSPEQASASPIDHRTDLYSTGLVLYELLSGERFFPKVNEQELLGMVARAVQPRLDRVSRELAWLVERLLAPRPSDRFQSAEDALAALPPWREIGPLGAVRLTGVLQSLDDPCGALGPSIVDCPTIRLIALDCDTLEGPTERVDGPARSCRLERPVLPGTDGQAPTLTREVEAAVAGAPTEGLPFLDIRDTIRDEAFSHTRTGLRARREGRLADSKPPPRRPRAGRKGRRLTRWIGLAAVITLLLGVVLGITGRRVLRSQPRADLIERTSER